MKALLLSLSLMTISAVAHAGLVGDFPSVQFGSTFVSVDGVCVSGDHVQTINKVSVCVETAHNKNGNCTKSESMILSTPINYTKEIPSTNHKFKTIEVTIPLDYTIGYGYPSKNGIRVVKTENFSLPVCE